MKSGVNIDCRYVVRVKKLMEVENLPSPRRRLHKPNRKLLDVDGSVLPLIRIPCEV